MSLPRHLVSVALGCALVCACAQGESGMEAPRDGSTTTPRADARPGLPDTDARETIDPADDAGPGPIELPICDFMAPSFHPPGGSSADQVPQFIVLGFDDNRYVDGMEWALDLLEGAVNPPGTGNPRTYDGQRLRATFYFTTNALDQGGPALREQWQRAVSDDHEIANHTHTHEVMNWATEIDDCNAALVAELGVSLDDIVGFRTPYLNYLQPVLLYPILDQFDNIRYDATLRHDPYYDYLDGGPTDFFVHIWPYTLDSGVDIYTAGNLAIGTYPGLWELPAYALPTSPSRAALGQPSQNFTGFDSTAYGTVGMSAAAFSDSMKWALDLRLEDGDNRAPLLIGLHSDTYSEQNTGYSQPLQARRDAVADFVAYALTKPDVRFVTAAQLLQWMCDPVPL